MPAEPLLLPEREEIRAGLAAGEAVTVIAARLGRHRCTISAEVNRNGGRDAYRATAAEKQADERRARPKIAKLIADPELKWHVTERLLARDSPMTISIELARGTHGLAAKLSHEAIYQAIYAHGGRGLPARSRGCCTAAIGAANTGSHQARPRLDAHRWGCSTRSAAARPSPQSAVRSAISKAT
jgi:IS30 family transposase